MTFKEMVDYIMGEIGSQRHKMSDKVPFNVADKIRGEPEHIDQAEHLADKYNKKERIDASGQDSPD